jgi:hypothetical protein
MLALLACSPQSGNTLDNAVETKMFEHTNTYCFGRFLVDIPREAALEGQSNEFYTKRIETALGKEEFYEEVKKILNKRKNETGKRGFKFLRNEYPEGGDIQIIVSKADLYGDIVYAIDVFALRKLGYYFYFTIEGYNENQIERIVDNWRKILPTLRYRPEYEIPREPGFCFENGFIAMESRQSWNEASSLYFILNEYPDVTIRISSDIMLVSEEPLIKRLDESSFEPWMRKESMRTREVNNNLKGSEVLLYGKKDGNLTHYFQFESFGEVKNPLKPTITMEVQTGGPIDGKMVSTALTNEQVRALYEKVLNSIRPRPTGDAAGPPPLDILFIETGK